MYIINILGLGPTDLLIDIFYIATIFCGISILIHKNAVVSIIYFMLVYVSGSLYLYYTGFSGMPLLIILIYVGAIAILFLFILTLINVKEQEEQNKYNSSSNIIIFVNLFIIFILYTYNYCKDLLVGSQLYNILDRIILSLSSGNQGYTSSDLSIYWNVPVLDYPVSSTTEVLIIGQSLYTTYGILLLLLGIILVLSIIAAIAILYTRPSVRT